ncbi:hypothetical protein HZQ94_14715 [Elizabethkingia anophelis]|nr:hypothetical protein [Elizabethkingia anophelis]MCT3682082.1 hypothetical protein [Elizabethkingia anophelis]
MRKIFTVLSLSAITMGTVFTSCSSSGNRDEQVQEKQDFTNANYIKGLMVGKWNISAYKVSSGWVAATDKNSTAYFIFKSDGTYQRKPYGLNSMNDFNETGTYQITPATSTTNASIKTSYTLNGKNDSDTFVLQSYENGEVTVSYITQTGSNNEKYKKE